MRGAVFIWLLCGLLGAPAAADIYRCTDARGAVRFVDDPASCAGATKHELKREIVASPPARRAERGAAPGAALAVLLPNASQVGAQMGAGWEITREALITEVDADQQGWGVLETHARHYGRVVAGVTEVCTIDLWRFAEAAQAAAAAQGIRYPGWSFEARDALLIALHGTRWKRGEAMQKGLFPDCFKLAALVKSP